MSESNLSPLENKLLEVIDKTQNVMEDAFIFGQEQIPDIIQQLLWWHGVKSFLLCVLLIGGCFLLLKLRVQLESVITQDTNDREFGRLFSWGFVSLVILVVLVLGLNLDWLQILIAPKLYILEYGAELLK